MTKRAKELAIHDKDTGSSEVQVAQLTDKIETLSKHIKQFKKDKHSSVGLLRAVNRRKKLLDYLKKNKIDPNYVQLIEKKERNYVNFMLSNMSKYIDIIIPRGGKSLVTKVQKFSKIPITVAMSPEHICIGP